MKSTTKIVWVRTLKSKQIIKIKEDKEKMTKNEFVIKLKEILKKAGNIAEVSLDWIVVSNDPDCDADFGIDTEGHLILGQKKTWLPLSKLESIRYRAISDEYAFNKFDSYISFCFMGSLKVFTGLACDTWPGDLFQMEYQKYSYLNKEIVASIIFSKKFNWSSLENGEIKAFYEREMESFLIR